MFEKGIIVQVIATLIIATGCYFSGYSTVWPSYTLRTLQSVDTPLETVATKFESNLIGSLPMLGAFVSSLYTGVLLDAFGRKKTLLLTGVCYVLSWSVISTAKTVTLVIISRFTVGLANGMFNITSIPIISEITQTSIQAAMIATLGAAYALGMLSSYLTGWFLTYEMVNYLNMSHAVVFVLMVVWLKETPAWLVTQGKDQKALKALQFYRGVSKPTEPVFQEINYLKELQNNINKPSVVVDEKVEKEKLESNIKEQPDSSAWKLLWNSTPNRRALIVATTNTTLLVFGGTVAVSTYAGQFFSQASPDLSPHMCSVILAITFSVGSLGSMVVTNYFGRRVLMISSSLASAACLALLSALLHFSTGPQWAVPATVVVYCCCFQLGVSCVPFVQLSEIFPSRLKSITTVIVMASVGIGNFIVLAAFTPTVDLLGLPSTFLIFSGICTFTAIFSFFFMKETKGVPLEVIQKMYEEGFLYRSNFVYDKVSTGV